MEWFKKHADTVVILAGILGCFVWIDGKFERMEERFSAIEKEITMIRTILIMRGIMPTELACEKKPHEVEEK